MAVQELLNTNQYLTKNYPGIVLDFSGIIDLTKDQLFDFCVKNSELRIEQTKEGKLIIMIPTGGESSERENSLSFLVTVWNRKHKFGKVFSPSGGFNLPNKAMRSPDVAYISLDKWKAIPRPLRKKFPPICPDFIVELKSDSDNINILKEKMLEWMDNGCRLGWLIDPYEEKAYIYRPNKEVELADSFEQKLSGEDVLPGFELDLSELREEED